MSVDVVTELHALAVLDVLDTAQAHVDAARAHRRALVEETLDRLEDALTRLDRLETVAAAA